jgi:hypothetical protein
MTANGMESVGHSVENIQRSNTGSGSYRDGHLPLKIGKSVGPLPYATCRNGHWAVIVLGVTSGV